MAKNLGTKLRFRHGLLGVNWNKAVSPHSWKTHGVLRTKAASLEKYIPCGKACLEDGRGVAMSYINKIVEKNNDEE